MFQSMLATGLTPLSNIKNEVDYWENKPFTTVWPESQQKLKEPEITRTIKKKTKRVRTTFTTDQLRALEKTFIRFRYVDAERRRELAAALGISDKTIKVWFQNRRMKEKRESSESSCDSSNDTLNVTPPPYRSPMIEQVDTNIYVNNVMDTPTVDSNDQHTYDQLYQPTYYQNNDYQMPPLTNDTFAYDTNVYPTQHYSYPHDINYGGYYPNHQYYQSCNKQDHDNWLENFDSGY